ncbi:hypothetical protein SPAN111604_04220 [Sphingomonas antarctica]|uniref:hypothetical protein n=1 Tax=Sphingomonas antarctica TaxID=2040274 RepID=UPI0039EB46F2
MTMMSVSERCTAVATFRHVSVWLMETAARWTPITAEMEAKVMFGHHIWDFAQMADILGKRTFELRRHEHYTVPPSTAYQAFLAEVAGTATVADRISALYDGVLPGLIARYRVYVAATDAILDEPTIVLAERIVLTLERQRAEAAALMAELGLASDIGATFAAREATVGPIVAQDMAA